MTDDSKSPDSIEEESTTHADSDTPAVPESPDEPVSNEGDSAPEPQATDLTVHDIGRATPDLTATELPTRARSEPEDAATSPSPDESASQSVDYGRTFKALNEGEVVDGVVVHIDKEGVLVDVGTKSEGIIRPGELSTGPVQAAEDVVSVGDHIDVYVMKTENDEGNPLLSKKRADFEAAWERVEQAHQEGKTITAMVNDRVKGGLVVDLGIRGFVPGSHVGTGKAKNLDRYVGQSLPFKVIEVDRERRKVVLSHRLAVEEDRSKQREKTISGLAEGQTREGVVRRITDYGAFIDLGGIDGLLHVSEMSWTRINHPTEMVKVGEKIQVMILKLNLDQGRVSLGLRQILPDPWAHVPQRYSVGDVVSGSVSRLVPFGAFVQLDGGIEGSIPNSELSHRRVKKPEDVVSVGQGVEARVLEVRAEERRMTLSIRQLQEEKDAQEYQSYRSSSSERGMTLGDLVGDKLQEFVSNEQASEPQPAEEAESPEAEATVALEAEESAGVGEEIATEAISETEEVAVVEDEADVEVSDEETSADNDAEQASEVETESVEDAAPEMAEPEVAGNELAEEAEGSEAAEDQAVDEEAEDFEEPSDQTDSSEASDDAEDEKTKD